MLQIKTLKKTNNPRIVPYNTIQGYSAVPKFGDLIEAFYSKILNNIQRKTCEFLNDHRTFTPFL